MKGNFALDNIGSFSVILTGDGSPSLRGDSEPMHHLGGAYSETQYIYGEALRRLLLWSELKKWRVLVVGLGLGYIELMAMAEALKNDKPVQILSYEVMPELVEAFLGWLQGKESEPVYDRLYEFYLKDYPGLNLKAALLTAYESGLWQIRGALNPESLPNEPYQCLLFDAFSGKSTPDLWTEDFLKQFLKQTVCDQAIFSTYACTGTLRRTLQEAHFKVEKRVGFLGKRNSTIATFGEVSGSVGLNKVSLI